LARYQKGQLIQTKSTFFLRYYQTNAEGSRTQKCVRLCGRVGHTRSDARKLAAPILEEVNGGFRTSEADTRLADFVTQVFQPWYKANKKPSTAAGYDRVWKCYLQSRTTSYTLTSFRTSDGSRILTELAASGLGRSTVYHVRAFLSKMFAISVSMGLIVRNPINRDCVMLSSPAEPKKTVEYSPQQIQAMLDALDDPRARAAIALCFYAGLRPGEIRGLQWQDYKNHELTIQRSVWQSKIGKTKTSETRTVPVIEPLPTILKELKKSQVAPDPGNYILSGDIVPINLDNLSRRVIGPALKANRIEWKAYYPGRRGISSLATKLNNPLVASGLLGHKNLNVTLKHYTKVSPESIRKGMGKVEELIKRGSE
jgi:integrase